MAGSEYLKIIDNLSEEIIKMADDIFDHPELPYEEYRTSALLADWIEKRGFDVQKGVGGIDTAFKAVYSKGQGGPNIGLILEVDALPNGHSCGHNFQGPVMLAAAYALKESDIEAPFTITVYCTPAEEVLTGKPLMIKAGCFKELDVALQTHAGNHTEARTTSLTGIDLETEFKEDESSMGLLAADNHNSGMEAYIFASHGMETLRAHVNDGTRIISKLYEPESGLGNGLKCCRSVFSARTFRMEDIACIERRMREIIEGAAKMSGCKAIINKTLDVIGLLKAPRLNELWLSKAKEVGATDIVGCRENIGGSNDFANITHMLPGTIIRFKTAPEGVGTHTLEFLRYSKSDAAHKEAIKAAKIVAMTCRDLIERPGLLSDIKSEFESLKAACKINYSAVILGKHTAESDADSVRLKKSRRSRVKKNSNYHDAEGNFVVEAAFTGIHAHDTAAPWNNRNGTDAMLLAIQGLDYLRGHVHDGTMIDYEIIDANGMRENRDPSHAALKVIIKQINVSDDMKQRAINVLNAAALMCGVRADITC